VRQERVSRIDRLPATGDVKEVLQAVLTDLLTNPELKSTRDFYGADKLRAIVLSDGGTVGWPERFQPDTHGYTVVPAKRDPFDRRRGVLAVRLDKFDLKQTKAEFFDAPIDMCLFNADGQVLGGLSVGYLPKRVGKRWTVELTYMER
jgi:hypothetical protein